MGECLAHSFAEAPTSHRASADKGATCFSQRINEYDDRSATLITTLAPDTPNELKGRFVQPGVEYLTQLDFYQIGDLAKAHTMNEEKSASSMIGCSTGNFVLVDVSGQNRAIDLPVGQVGWRLSLLEEDEDNAHPNPLRTKLILAKTIPSKKDSKTLDVTSVGNLSESLGVQDSVTASDGDTVLMPSEEDIESYSNNTMDQMLPNTPNLHSQVSLTWEST